MQNMGTLIFRRQIWIYFSSCPPSVFRDAAVWCHVKPNYCMLFKKKKCLTTCWHFLYVWTQPLPAKDWRKSVKREDLPLRAVFGSQLSWLSRETRQEEVHPSRHIYGIGALVPATAPLSSPVCFPSVRERETVTCETTDKTGHTEVCAVVWLYVMYSECKCVWMLKECVYK